MTEQAGTQSLADQGPPGGWSFAGWGSSEKIEDIQVDPNAPAPPSHKKLGQFAATAICGNDITSSCLYVSALAGMAAGPVAPFALLVVAAVLYLFRKIYAEVGSALPLNGGTYTLLLNSSNKKAAAVAAVLTILSYVATAVISAGEAMHYLHEIVHWLPIFWATIGLLSVFAVLNLIGISESAGIAMGIFTIHIITLTILVVVGVVYVFNDPSVWNTNMIFPPLSEIPRALFLGFAAAMLGISGFESSANFIEEQADGVFPKTLRNMWIAVAFFNPAISFLSMGIVKLEDFETYQNSMLSIMALRAGGETLGPWLSGLVSINAVLVLSGAVLTSFVGVTGLMRRMTLDRCLPQFLLAENTWRKTNHWIILAFLVLSCSIYVITGGHVGVLAGVYALSFLAVMLLFAFGNGMLKVKRGRLPRDVIASWPAVVIGFVAVLIGLVGNLSVPNLEVFGTYFVAIGLLVAVMFLRVPLMRGVMFASQAAVDKVEDINTWIATSIEGVISTINDQDIIYFTKGDNIATLNRAALYVLENEQSTHLKVLHIYEDESEIPPELAHHLNEIDHMYPQLRIDFIAVKGKFSPEFIDEISKRLNVPKNYMFIGTPGDRFPHEIAKLGGVRLII